MKQPQQLGPYRIESVLGKGGMGSVFQGVHTETGERVAIKALNPQLAANEGFIKRFEAEIESLRQLDHESIVKLFAYGQQDLTHFYVMELVDGPNLDHEIRNGRRFTWREVTDIAIQICRALKHAHDHGMIHRDIKPGNILITASGVAKLADFGIVKYFGGNDLTVTGSVVGTADYMAPEQIGSQPVTDKVDQYSLGGVMYCLLAGRAPFVAKSLPEMLRLQCHVDPEPLRRYAPETPDQLVEVIEQMLSKEPDDRFPNAMVLGKHLEAMRIALSQPPQPSPGDQAPPNASPSNNTMNALHWPAGTTRDYQPGKTAVNTRKGERLVVNDHDQTPHYADQATAQGLGAAPTLAAEEATEEAVAPTDERPRKRSLFTVVTDEHSTKNTPNWMLAIQALVALVVLGAFGRLAVQWLGPPDANTLHRSIEASLEGGGADALRAAATEVESFLQRFPDDPRADDLRRVQESIDLDRLQRRLVRNLRLGRGPDADASPVERLYYSAIGRLETNPAAAVAELEALMQLISSQASDDESLQEFAMLAKQQIKRLHETIAAEQQVHRPFVESQLVRAQQLAAENPQESQSICQAIIALYAKRPWAAELVEQAKQLLNQLDR